MPPKDEHGISTDLAIKIGEIIGKLDQLIKTVDESKVQTNNRMDEFETRLNDHDRKLAQREIHVPIFEAMQKRLDALEEKADQVAGGAKGIGVLGTILKDFLFPAAIAVVAFFGAHFVWDKHDERAVKPVIVNPPAIVQQAPKT